MANITTLKQLYQPISSAATKNVLAGVSQQQKDLQLQQASQQKLMKNVMSIGSKLGKDYKGYKLAKKAGYGMDLEELRKNPEFEKHIRAGGTLEDFDQGFGGGLKGFMDWRSAPDVERKQYHQAALEKRNLIGFDKDKLAESWDVNDSFELPGSSLAIGKEGQSILTGQDLRLQRKDDVHPLERGKDKRKPGEKYLDEQYKRILEFGPEPPKPEIEFDEEIDPDEFSLDTIEPGEDTDFDDIGFSPEVEEFTKMLDLSKKHGVNLDSQILKPRKGIAGLFGGKEFKPLSSYADVMDAVIDKEKSIDEALRNKEINKKEAAKQLIALVNKEKAKFIEKNKQDNYAIQAIKTYSKDFYKDKPPLRRTLNKNLPNVQIGSEDDVIQTQKDKSEQFQSAQYDKEYQSLKMNKIIPEEDWSQLGPKEKFELLRKHKGQIQGGGFQGIDKKNVGEGLKRLFQNPEKQSQEGSNQYTLPEDFYKDKDKPTLGSTLNKNLPGVEIGSGEDVIQARKDKTEQYQSAKFDKEYQSLGMNKIIPEKDWNQLGAKEKFELLRKHKKQIEGGGFQRIDKKNIGEGLRNLFQPNESSPLFIDRPSPSLYPQGEKFYE